MQYGFIGAGNMCSAIINGLNLNGGELFVYDICPEKCRALGTKAKICADNDEVIANAEMLIIGVKPNALEPFLQDHCERLLHYNPLIISLAVGKTLETLEKYLGRDTAIVRVMPNINSFCLASTTGFCCNKAVSFLQKSQVQEVFTQIGNVMEISDEGKFSIFAAIAGSSPAFAYMYIDALARAAQKAGMSREQALQVAADTVAGSAKMLLQSSEHPYALIDRVCSPGGTTIEGVAILQEKGFEAAVTAAIDAVLAKDKKLSV